MKTLAIRLEEDQHAQLTMLAQLSETTVTDAIRQAIDQWIEQTGSNPKLQERAQAVLEEIEHDAATRRNALASLIKSEQPTLALAPAEPDADPKGSKPSPTRAPRSKGGEPATS